jgi:hypothetical protein
VPPPEALEQTARFPAGWVYEIDGSYGPEDAVPPVAIRGAWQVRPDGTLWGVQTQPRTPTQGRRRHRLPRPPDTFRRSDPHLTATVTACARLTPPRRDQYKPRIRERSGHVRSRCMTYGPGCLRRSGLVRKYTDKLIRASVAAAIAPAHQYQPPSVTAATIKPAASTTSVMASPSRHHRGNPELTL